MFIIKRILVFITLLPLLIIARNADDLKNDLQGIMPPGKDKALLAWVKGAEFTEFPYGLQNTAVYVVNSDDGAIRKLYPSDGLGSYSMVNISADGSRVFFYDWASDELVAVDWDGSNEQRVDVGGMAVEYWRNPDDGSDWAIVEQSDMKRVNIDNPSQQVQVCPLACGGDGCGLSDDGKKFMGYDYNRSDGDAAFGLWDIATQQWTYGWGGCQGSMRAGSSYSYGHNGSGHEEWTVHNPDGTLLANYQTAPTITTWLTQNNQDQTCGESHTAEASRFTQHPDFMTTMIAYSKVNPILVRLPDLEIVYIEDNLDCMFCGDMDAVFLPIGDVGAQQRVLPPGAIARNQQHSGEALYNVNGRRLTQNPHRKEIRGLVISKAGSRVEIMPAGR